MKRQRFGGRALALAGVSVLWLHDAAAGVTSSEKDAGKIMRSVEARNEGQRLSSRMQMVVVPSSGRKVTRKMRNFRLAGDDMAKRVLLFESPADERNTGLLIFDYEDRDRSDDQWLYLPSLRKSTRISGGDKSGAFMGSDFTFSDMTKQHAANYTYKLLKPSAKVGKEDCWLIEARPKTDRIKSETGYLKSELWVSKDKLMVVQIKAWVSSGKKIKLIKLDDIRNVDGVWVPHKLAARTMRGAKVESTTFLTVSDVKANDGALKDGDFTQRRLEQGL